MAFPSDLPPRPIVMASERLQVMGTGVVVLALGMLCLWVYGHARPDAEQAWVALVLGVVCASGGVWMLVFSPWWRVEMDAAQGRIIADSGTRFSRKRRVLPYSAVDRLEVRHIGSEGKGTRRHALFLLLRDGSALQLGNWERDRGGVARDEMLAARALGDALPEPQRPPRMFSPTIGGAQAGHRRTE